MDGPEGGREGGKEGGRGRIRLARSTCHMRRGKTARTVLTQSWIGRLDSNFMSAYGRNSYVFYVDHGWSAIERAQCVRAEHISVSLEWLNGSRINLACVVNVQVCVSVLWWPLLRGELRF